MIINDVINSLHGSEYPDIGDKELFAKMEKAGLVAVFGHSDDCMEFRGALYDEFYDEVAVTERGIINNFCDEGDRCPNWREPNNAFTVKPVFGGDPAWVFETAIPHETFEVMEDGEVFQRGIVFRLTDAGPR